MKYRIKVARQGGCMTRYIVQKRNWFIWKDTEHIYTNVFIARMAMMSLR